MSNNNDRSSRFVWQPGDITTDECPKCGFDGAPATVTRAGTKICPKCGAAMRPLGGAPNVSPVVRSDHSRFVWEDGDLELVEPDEPTQKSKADKNGKSRFVWEEGDLTTHECPKCKGDSPVLIQGKKHCKKCGTPMVPLSESSNK